MSSMRDEAYVEHFWARVTQGDGCWTWQGGHTTAGYPVLYVRGRPVYAHRFVYDLMVGPIPEGLVIDHLCRNPGCVNPYHLEPVTQLENVRRGRRGRLVTHCPKGHEYTPENIIWKKGGTGGKYMCRGCRKCLNVGKARRAREARQRRKASQERED